ncbi:MAG: hypothetical protein F8N36_13850 [Desulfovibrio sp.]|uniref:hypothetical protein n=1 Tax=Desulfovibrio sp. TaxID=885 RepID=UPI00135EA6EA|nr:hypothetical protein [Desulfovibrio sp.]MTJ93922.1 hypothetical protein [Desulfovibrio sp.]
MGVGADDPAFAWAIAAGHVHQAIDQLPAAMREAAEENLTALKALFEEGRETLAEDTADHLREEIDKAIAAHIAILRDLLAGAVRDECRHIDDSGAKLEALLDASGQKLETLLKSISQLPENMAQAVANASLVDKLPAIIEQSVRDKLVLKEQTKRTVAVGVVVAVALAGVVFGGLSTWLFEQQVYRAEFDVLQAKETTEVNAKLGEARELLALARPFSESLLDPTKRARIEWTQENPGLVDVVRTDAGKALVKLAQGYKGALDVRAPYPCITLGPRTMINGTMVNRTCSVALPND